ncbi:hypothetical protein [Antarctobacter jejuensis]|uniref:hypothetical protein n=1 Tax=Antarctobacter jejuensis TaxID=1439938 RepID=UPI003FD2237D
MRAAEGTVLGAAAALSALAGAVRAASLEYDCLLTRDDANLRLSFTFEPASFAPALDPADPPRRQVSRVTVEGATFEAEALLTGDGTRGFWAAGRGLMLTRAPDGAARLTDDAHAAPWHGHCEEAP